VNAASIELLDRLWRWETDRGRGIAYVGPMTMTDGGNTEHLTWSTLAQRVRNLARELKQRIPEKTVVLVSLENALDFPIAFLAVLASGRSVFPVNPDLAPPERREAIERSGAAATIEQDLKIESLPTSPPPIDQASLLLSSTGTTGRPKIVLRPANSVDAVSRNMVEAIGFTANDRVLATVPLCHSYGLEHGLLAPVWAGSQVQLCRGLDMAVMIDRLTRGGISIWPGVPAMFEMIANTESRPGPELKAAYSAGGAFPRVLWERVAQLTGIRVGQVYGATEIGSITYGNPREASFDPATVGRPMNGVEIQLLEIPGAGESGHQIAARATSMMSGYVGEPATITPDGFFPTGDLGCVDNAGNIRLTGRLKLLIDVGGLKVSPMEVEAVLCEHPSVAECIVLPLPLSPTVNRLRAIVTPRGQRTTIDVEELREFARKRLSPHKVPRVFEVRTSLPKSQTGKVLRHLVAVS
jgi:acyl-CoA synthetase (AMP-forming)/AMP-acid ligase II